MPENNVKNRAKPTLGTCVTVPVVAAFGAILPSISIPKATQLFNMWQKIGTNIVTVLR